MRPHRTRNPGAAGALGADGHFYFHIRNGIGYVPDEEGLEMPDLESARREAIRSARSIVASEVMQGVLDLDGLIEVTNRSGQRLLTISYREAVSAQG